jgi:putative transposase
VRRAPKYLITDQGVQFSCAAFREWCRRRGIDLRFGAVGSYGSLAVIERFIRSMKDECTRGILVPLRLGAVRRQIDWYVGWHNHHRPSQALGGRTPAEVYEGVLGRRFSGAPAALQVPC